MVVYRSKVSHIYCVVVAVFVDYIARIVYSNFLLWWCMRMMLMLMLCMCRCEAMIVVDSACVDYFCWFLLVVTVLY